jgi:hypothetical protein
VPGRCSPRRDSDRDFVVEMVRISVRLHGAKRLMLFGHADCGACGHAPPEAVIADVGKAAGYLAAVELRLQIESYFCDFDGAYRL